MESNSRLAYEWKIMQEYTKCLIKDKMLYAMGVIEEFHPNFSVYSVTEQSAEYVFS
jgi:hypothetical protein